MRVGIIGVGWYGFTPSTPELSFREMVFEAALRAYEDAHVNPRRDVDTFVSCQEDFWEGISISGEFAPDPIGGTLRPVMTVPGDSVQAIMHAVMHIESGISKVTVVESHAKPSDIITMEKIMEFAYDPLYGRIGARNFHFLAGLDAVKFMERTKATKEDLAEVVVKNKRNGLKNPRGSYSSSLSIEEVVKHPYVVYPLTSLDISPFTDAAVVIVLANEEVARKYTDDPIWITGVGVGYDSTMELSELGRSTYLRLAADKAFKIARLHRLENVAFFVDDTYSYKELQHLEALKVQDPVKKLREGELYADGKTPVNPLGGHLSEGRPLDASGLALLLDAVEFMRRGEFDKVVVASWRGVPSFTGGVVVLER